MAKSHEDNQQILVARAKQIKPVGVASRHSSLSPVDKPKQIKPV